MIDTGLGHASLFGGFVGWRFMQLFVKAIHREYIQNTDVQKKFKISKENACAPFVRIKKIMFDLLRILNSFFLSFEPPRMQYIQEMVCIGVCLSAPMQTPHIRRSVLVAPRVAEGSKGPKGAVGPRWGGGRPGRGERSGTFHRVKGEARNQGEGSVSVGLKAC